MCCNFIMKLTFDKMLKPLSSPALTLQTHVSQRIARITKA